jgi:hypothetical protein
MSQAWITDALAQRSPQTVVDRVRVLNAVKGTGTKFKLALDYASNPHDLPAVMWLKSGFASAHQAALLATGSYYREARFYGELLPHLDVRVPRCYFAEADRTSGQGLILMEDLAPPAIRFASCDVPHTVKVVTDGLRTLARMHALWWDSTELVKRELDQPLQSGAIENHFRRFDFEWVLGFIEGPVGDVLPAALRDPQRLLDGFWALRPYLHQPPLCLTHGDLHIGNTYVENGHLLGMVDWSAHKRAPWAYDVSYFIGSSLSVEDRRDHERSLLEFYLGELHRQGGPALDPDDSWTTYRRFMMYGFFLWVRNAPSTQPIENNVYVSSRLGPAVDDLGTLALLGV